MNEKNQYKVLMVGCGQIAGGFDYGNHQNTVGALTHALAFQQQGEFELTACVDPDLDRLLKFKEHWQFKQVAPSLQALKAKPGDFDVISICSPTAFHAEHLIAALSLKPKLVFCEKPLTHQLEEAEAIVASYQKAGIALMVNYTRRWHPEFQQRINELKQGHWGKIRSINAVYNKGLLNNGSHLIDLLLWLFDSLEVVYAGAPIHDAFEEDPSHAFVLQTTNGLNIMVNLGHAQDFSFFEIEFITEKGWFRFYDGGSRLQLRTTQPSQVFPGYTHLNTGQQLTTDSLMAFPNAIAEIATWLKNEQQPKPMSCQTLTCQGEHALATLRFAQAIKKAATHSGKNDA